MSSATEISTGTISDRLGEFVAGLGTTTAVPDDVLDHAALCLLDSLGCGIFGARLPWSSILRDGLLAMDTTQSCHLIGTTARLSAPHAALANGAAIHAFELDDLHRRSIVHPGSVVIPAAMAVASSREISGTEFLTAMVAGYEVAARVGNSMGTAHLLQGFHPTGTHGTFGAAVAAGRLLGLEGAALAQAIGIAGTQASGLMSAQYASMVKRFHAGHAAQSGVYGAFLAARGYVGIHNIFEAEYGAYGPTMSPSSSLEAITQDLGSTWEARMVGFKPYSTNGSCHPTIDILLSLIAEHGIHRTDVSQVHVEVSTATKEHVGWPYVPESVTTAQMNLPYIVAVTLSDNDAFVHQFAESRITDPELVEFAGRVEVVPDPQIDAEGDEGRHHTRIRVVLEDGRVLTGERRWARGSRNEPMTWDDVEAKFHKLCDGVIPMQAASELVAIVGSLRDVDDMRDVLVRLAQ